MSQNEPKNVHLVGLSHVCVSRYHDALFTDCALFHTTVQILLVRNRFKYFYHYFFCISSTNNSRNPKQNSQQLVAEPFCPNGHLPNYSLQIDIWYRYRFIKSRRIIVFWKSILLYLLHLLYLIYLLYLSQIFYIFHKHTNNLNIWLKA
jgi:hypothetical protein